jgi:type I restriction enzyme M protein
MTQEQLESYLWAAATLLRGLIDAGDYKQYVFPLLFFKRISDVYDEERAAALELYGDDALADLPENHRFQVLSGAHWEDVRQKSTDIGQALTSAMRAIEAANPDKLTGVFGNAQWTNKERLPDRTLTDLIEHFSTESLSVARLPEDELGQGYEYLIKKFADDSGHSAQEFYTNRTLVRLMTLMLDPQPGESVYDPTCGTAGMLVSAATELKNQGKEFRTLRLFGQESNHMTSSIARMNLFLHGIEDFQVEQDDTLANPRFTEGGRLKTFDVVLANPPYSIKNWDREAFAHDPWGRNRWGTPPQGRADYAFFQHIAASLDPVSGRAAILFPHGVLFRNEEAEMRCALIGSDLIEAVLGLGSGLFYNSPMEAVVVVLWARKPEGHRRKILFINAVNEYVRERAQSFLSENNIRRIHEAYVQFRNEDGFTAVVDVDDVLARGGSLAISLYVDGAASSPGGVGVSLEVAVAGWITASEEADAAVVDVLAVLRQEVER